MDSDTVTYKEAMRLTGLTQTSIHTYVSRGKFSRVEGKRGHLYRSEVDAYREKKLPSLVDEHQATQSAMAEEVEVPEVSPFLLDSPMPIQLMGTVKQNIQTMEILLAGYHLMRSKAC
jgi:hypothetical protein